MPQPHNQKAFHSGEWAPQLYGRVDLNKYHAGAALLENFYVDYRGGASTRAGTKYSLQAYKSATPVRLIPFQASSEVGFAMEFGQNYIRFHSQGAPVIETGKAITGITKANPGVVTENGHGYSNGDWVFIQNVGGMAQVNDRFFQVAGATTNTYQLQDLNGNNVDTSTYTAYTAGGTGSRVYTIPSNYLASDLALLKFAQNVTLMIFCHPAYPPAVLTFISATNWTLQPIQFGSTVNSPTGIAVATTLAAGTVHYSYTVTAVDNNGQESGPGTPGALDLHTDITTNAGTNTVTWTAVPGAVSYNIYESIRSYAGAIPGGVTYGFVGSASSTTFIDTNIAPDFAETPPISQNPFFGASVASVTVTNPGDYTAVPLADIAAPASGHQAIAAVTLQALSVTVPAPTPNGFNVGEIMTVNGAVGGLQCVVATVDGSGKILTLEPMTFPGSNPGAITGAGTTTPPNPVDFEGTLSGFHANLDVDWGIGIISIINAGDGYTSVPAVNVHGGSGAGGGAGTAVLGPASAGNPSVPAFFQQRLVLAAPLGGPQTFYMSKPGAYYNFDVSDPVQADDAITGTIIGSQLNTIKSMLPMPGGLVVLTSRQAWQINGGTAGSAVTPIDATAQAQAYNGSSDVPPIVANYDILYVQSKGSIVRDLSFNFYTNIYTGTDISILSSHLFFGFTITEWAFAEEPFKVVWAVRNDGVLLSLTFLKEQEVVGWAHSVTNGSFKSVCAITEDAGNGLVDAVYVVVERIVNGNTVQYIERMADRFTSEDEVPSSSTWCVDAGVAYSGAPSATFTGAEHLAGLTVTGIADSAVITPFVMPVDGFFTLPAPVSEVLVGIGYTCTLRTLILDLGEPTVIGKLKKLIGVTVRGCQTLGIKFGRTLSSLVALKDFSGVRNSQGVTVPYQLTTTDSRQLIDPKIDQDGQYYIVQDQPLPATILGVVPDIHVEDQK